MLPVVVLKESEEVVAQNYKELIKYLDDNNLSIFEDKRSYVRFEISS